MGHPNVENLYSDLIKILYVVKCGLSPHFHPENVSFAWLTPRFQTNPSHTPACYPCRSVSDIEPACRVASACCSRSPRSRRPSGQMKARRPALHRHEDKYRLPAFDSPQRMTTRRRPGRRGVTSKVVRRMVSPDWKRWPISGRVF